MQLPVDTCLDWDGPPSEGDDPRTVDFQGPTCNYQSDGAGAGSSRSICGLVALNYARLSLGLEVGDEASESLLQRMMSPVTMKDTMSIIEWDELKGISFLDIDDLLDVPFFQETLSTKATTKDIKTVEDVEDLFSQWFPDSSNQVHAALFSSHAEVMACISFFYSGSQIYSLFDPHARPDHKDHPTVTFSRHLDDITARLHNALSLSTKFSGNSSPHSDISAHLLQLKEGPMPDFKDVLSRSATYLARRQIGADDTGPSFFVESDHISQLRFRAQSLRRIHNGTCSDLDVLSGPSLQSAQKEKKISVGPSRGGEFGWQLSLLLEPNPISITVSDGDENEEAASIPVNLPDHLHTGNDDSGADNLWQPQRKSEYSWLTSIVRQSSTHTVWSSSEDPFKEFVSHIEPELLAEKTDTWETALLQQLQEEEEISASLPHHVSSDHTWLVSLQKRLQEEDSHESDVIPTSALRSELDWQLAVQLQQEVLRGEGLEVEPEGARRRHPSGNFLKVPSWRESDDIPTFDTLDLPNSSFEPHFECGICAEMCHPREKMSLPDCDHKFCRNCLTTFTKTKIEDGRYPIFCPECFIIRTRTTKSQVTQDVVGKLDLTAGQLEKLEELQLRAHSVTLDCPRCRQTMKIDRQQYGEQSVVVCPLPECGHKWCKTCLKEVASSQENHRCKNNNIDRLMKRKGWKYCPGCRTPVQKETGCNHMTCGAPGCNTHFCYRCGVLMIDTTNGGDVGTAVTEHYLNCRLFEKRLKCSIQ